jgi:hypothetical protein
MAEKYQRYKSGNPVCDAFRFLCDASFAILPRDAAHQLGEFEKNFWGGVRWFAEKSIGRIDESLAAADWLRDEWRRRSETPPTEATAGPEPL